MVYYYPHFKDKKTEAGGALPSHTDSKRWRRGLYSVLPGPKAHAFNHCKYIASGCQGSSFEGKSFKQVRGKLSLREIPEPREICWPTPQSPLLSARHQGHRPQCLGVCWPSRHAQSERLHAVSQEPPTLRPTEGHAQQPCELAPAWPEVEILSVALGMSMTMARGSSSSSLLASAAASVFPSGLLGVSGP